MKALVYFAIFLSFGSFAAAQLRWEQKEIEFRPAVTDTEIKTEFRFTNAGREPVTIESVTPGCGCTTATPDKATYQPGEKGRIAATFTIGQRTGEQHKPIRVKLHGDSAVTTLMIVAHLPELMKISPQFVFWAAGEAPRPKTIDLTILPDAHLQVTRVLTTDPKIKATLETVEGGRTYKVLVTPDDTTEPATAVLSIDTTMLPNVQKIFTAWAQVKPSASSNPPFKSATNTKAD